MINEFISKSGLRSLPDLLGLLVFFAGAFLTPLALPSPQDLTRESTGNSDAHAHISNRIASASLGGVEEAWVARYDGPVTGDDQATAMAVDSSGNVYVSGASWGKDSDSDYATIKYNSAGQAEWIARYNGPGNYIDNAAAIAVDSTGNVYVTGYSFGSGTWRDYATIKYSGSGQQEWVARYNGPGNDYDYAVAIVVDDSGNVYVTGSSWGSGFGFDYATIKYNSVGQQQWVARYNTGPFSFDNQARAIAIDSLGNVYVTGWSNISDPIHDYATIKYNAAGQEQWVARYNGPGDSDDFARAVGVDDSGNVYVTGGSYGLGHFEYATIKYNSLGQQQWVARYDGPTHSDSLANALALDNSSNVYVTGSTIEDGNLDYATIKYDSSGQEQWIVCYDGPKHGRDEPMAITVDASNNAYVTGDSPGVASQSDYATVKYNSAGAEEWVLRYDGPAHAVDVGAAIAIDSSGSVYVTGRSTGVTSPYFDYATIKYVREPTPTPTPSVTPTSTATPRPTPTPRPRPRPLPRPT
jgi:hypothetical protein